MLHILRWVFPLSSRKSLLDNGTAHYSKTQHDVHLASEVNRHLVKQCHRCLIPTGHQENLCMPHRVDYHASFYGAVDPTYGMMEVVALGFVLCVKLTYSHKKSFVNVTR